MVALFAFAAALAAQPYTFEQVASGLKHKDPATRLRAIQILRDADYPDAVAPIGNALGDADDRVQMAAIEAERALFMLHPVSRRTKVGFIIEKRTTAGDAAAGQLALKPRPVPPEVLGGLVLALSDSNPRVRTGAIGLAALVTPVACRPERTGCAQVGNALIENINSREPAVRRDAMDALGRQQYSNAVQALMDQYSYYQKGPDAQAAAEALARIGHAASISTFEELLTSSDAQMRRFAVEGLARAGHRDAIPALQQMGQSERSNSVLLALHFANLALGVPGSSVVEIVAAARDAALRPLAAQYLLDLAPGQAPALSESLRDPDPDTRRLVADILGFSQNAGITPALTEATKDSDPDVAQAAQRALERLKL
ncbi:MAG: hypothetical protein EHM55_16250 [Acidobacteria bacterium]|nr:MAG: hypothetical protein EHM55_16250 [Acidobacteriota bacterium]